MIQFIELGGALLFGVRVVPRASRSEVVGEHDGALRVRLAAPPVEGAANVELISTLARAFHVPARNVEIMSGHASKTKRVRIVGGSSDALEKLADLK